jgi:anti-anti-sigma factor
MHDCGFHVGRYGGTIALLEGVRIGVGATGSDTRLPTADRPAIEESRMHPPTTEAVELRKRVVGAGFAYVRLPAAGASRLHLTGELDVATADRARAFIRLAQDDSHALICDLGDLWFIDVTGLRLLLDADVYAEHTGRRLIIANAPPILARMLLLLKLNDALEAPAPPLRTPGVRECDAFRRHVS